MDLACALDEWVRGDSADLQFIPVEQAQNLTIRARGAMVDFYAMPPQGFLAAFATDVRREAPKAVHVRGPSWLSMRSGGQPV